MDDSEHDVLAYMAFPAQHRTVLFEQNDEWSTQYRYMQVEALSRSIPARSTRFSEIDGSRLIMPSAISEIPPH